MLIVVEVQGLSFSCCSHDSLHRYHSQDDNDYDGTVVLLSAIPNPEFQSLLISERLALSAVPRSSSVLRWNADQLAKS